MSGDLILDKAGIQSDGKAIRAFSSLSSFPGWEASGRLLQRGDGDQQIKFGAIDNVCA